MTNTAVICVMGVSLNLTTPIKFSLTLINSDVDCIFVKCITELILVILLVKHGYSTFSDFSAKKLKLNFDCYI